MKLRVTPIQATSLAVLDCVGNAIGSAIVILRDSVGAKDVADMLLEVGGIFEKRKGALIESWQKSVQLAAPADLKSVILDKAH